MRKWLPCFVALVIWIAVAPSAAFAQNAQISGVVKDSSGGVIPGQINMYAHQLNIGVNRMITRDLAVTADVTSVYRYGDRDTVEVNLPDQTSRVRPYPPFVRVNFWQPTADNFYKALLVKLEKRMSNRYQFLTSYTLSSAEDDNVNLATPTANIGAGNDAVTGRPLFGTSTSLLPNTNAPSRQAEFAIRVQF